MVSSPTHRPVRTDGLEINEVADGLVVYQAAPERVHYLNNTAAVVFELCDGDLTVAEIADALRRLFSLASAPTAEVEACLVELAAKGVVQ
jgi:Coenzyme PQQ synthesis protein D (PqqD)